MLVLCGLVGTFSLANTSHEMRCCYSFSTLCLKLIFKNPSLPFLLVFIMEQEHILSSVVAGFTNLKFLVIENHVRVHQTRKLYIPFWTILFLSLSNFFLISSYWSSYVWLFKSSQMKYFGKHYLISTLDHLFSFPCHVRI